MASAWLTVLLLLCVDTPAALSAESAEDEQPALDLADRRADAEDAGEARESDSSDMSLDLDRWVMHDVLEHGPGQSLHPEHDANDTLEGGAAHFTHEPAEWTERVARRRAALALRGAPQQRRDVHETGKGFDIPLRNHPLVDVYIDYFTGRGRWFFARWLERSSALMPLMQDILSSYGLPKDLVYVAMIESGFSSRATSFAAASGYWQFMPSTGALFGLKQDRFVDERRDFIAATQAAGRFLQSLHRHFHGDWHLAWASYNAGEHRIRRAMAKTGADNFWQLIERRHGLAKETVHYVPKVIAAAIVAKDAERYGFRITPLPRVTYEQVTVDGALDVRVLAKHMKVPLEPLRALNPALLYDITPPNRRTRLRVPVGLAKQTEASLASLPRQRRLEFVAYRVRRGDTLGGIARRMHASLDNLRQFNRLSSSRVRQGQQLVVPSALVGSRDPLPAVSAKALPARRPGKARARKTGSRRPAPLLSSRTGSRVPKARHVVASGETLWSIARRYGVTVDTLGRQSRKSARALAVGDVVDIF